MSGASLCSGYGGLDLAARELFGGDVIVHGETYEPACTVLDEHWPGVPNVGDITTAGWSPWAGQVDWFTAGWPCQPWSSAGKRKGADDERAIWPAVARAIRDLRPRVVLLENVSRVVVAGELGRALGDLAALRFDAEWRCVRASDIGAPHRRERCFILAVAQDADRATRGERRLAASGETEGGRSRADTGRRGGAPAADAGSAGLEVERVESARQERQATQRGGGAAADPAAGLVGGSDAAQRGDVDWAGYAPAIHRWESILARSAPAPVALGRRGGRQLSPQFVEWLMGLPAGWATDVPGITRNEQLHLLGNGVVPQQAVAAFRSMIPAFASEAAA